jgi:hypothetical protein
MQGRQCREKDEVELQPGRFTKNIEEKETTMDAKPTHEQAQLHLQIYDMRREARLRQARDWFFKNYFVDNLDDWMRLAAPGTETGAFVMMVLSYWDQACAMLNYGLLHENLFFETSGEFFGVWERVKPVVQQARSKCWVVKPRPIRDQKPHGEIRIRMTKM